MLLAQLAIFCQDLYIQKLKYVENMKEWNKYVESFFISSGPEWFFGGDDCEFASHIIVIVMVGWTGGGKGCRSADFRGIWWWNEADHATNQGQGQANCNCCCRLFAGDGPWLEERIMDEWMLDDTNCWITSWSFEVMSKILMPNEKQLKFGSAYISEALGV